MKIESGQPVSSRRSRPYLLPMLVVAAVLILALWISFPVWPPDPRCALLLASSQADEEITLPATCTLTANVGSDEMVKYLDQEREQRGLVFKRWITCQEHAERTAFSFEHDPRWLPSYKPRAYQFRRTVVILPYAEPIPKGSPVVAEICLMPRRRFASLIEGQCNGKFAVWK